MNSSAYNSLLEAITSAMDTTSIRSAGIFGSKPAKLAPGKDLDVAVLMRAGQEQTALDHLTQVMDAYVSAHPEHTYTLYRGPIKDPARFQVHFVTYTDASEGPCSYQQEVRPVLDNVVKQFDHLAGEDFSTAINHADASVGRNVDTYMQAHVSEFKEQATLSFRAWYKEDGAWTFEKRTRTPNSEELPLLTPYFSRWENA